MDFDKCIGVMSLCVLLRRSCCDCLPLGSVKSHNGMSFLFSVYDVEYRERIWQALQDL